MFTNRTLTLTLCVLSFATFANAEPPELTGIFPLGGSRGATIDVTVTTADAKPQAIFSIHPGITAKQIEGKKFAVTIADDVPEGDYDVWLVTASGLSNPRRFAVGAWPNIMETETPQRNDKPQAAQSGSVPAAINGSIDPATDRDCFRFSLDANQRLTIRCRSTTLEGTVLPALTLFDPSGREVLHDTGNLVEAVLDYRAATVGEYVVQIEDRAFRKDLHSAYRLELFTGPRLAAAFPTTLTRGVEQPVTLFGFDLPGGEPAGAPFLKDLQRTTVSISVPQIGAADGGGLTFTNSALLEAFRYRQPHAAESIRFGLIDGPLMLETDSPHATRQTAQPVTVPCEIAGRLLQPGEVDWYRFTAKKGETLWIEAVGERGSAAMDLDIAIQDSTGKIDPFTDTAHAKEFPSECPLDTLDPSGTWKAAADGEYALVIRDLYGSVAAGISPGYRLSIGPRREAACIVALPLKTDKPGGLTVAAGKSAEWQLVAVRRGGHEKAIRIRAENLPVGLEMTEAVIDDKKFITKLNLTAAKDAAPWVGLVTLVAETEIDGRTQSIPVRVASYLPGIKPPRARLTQGLAAAVIVP